MSLESLRIALDNFPDPENGIPLAQGKQIRELNWNQSTQTLDLVLALTSWASPLFDHLRAQIETLVQSQLPETRSINLKIENHPRPAMPLGQVGLTAKSVIAVGAGKGGVGKSTVSLCLALALKRAGCRVGLMDADVYGPSIPHLTGVRGQVAKSGEKIGPLNYDGMPLISIGFMVPPDKAVIWRGPMLHSAVTTFVRDVDWGNLDYLIIDMPPGTGDVALSLSQLLPITGAVVVCTPQEVALIDAIKAVSMFQQVNIPIAGVVENMSSFICPDNGKRYDIFGKGGARQYAEEAHLPFLGEIPINIALRERGDSGQSVLNFDDPQVAPYLKAIGFQLALELSKKKANSPIKQALPVL